MGERCISDSRTGPALSSYHPAGDRLGEQGSKIWVPVRRDPPKISAHHPILVERASCPQRPCDCNYGGKADHASEADQHDVEIIARNLRRPTQPELACGTFWWIAPDNGGHRRPTLLLAGGSNCGVGAK